MTLRLDVIGAPTSAGAYAPGQERAPAALRAAGLLERLRERGVAVNDRGDVPGFRWQVDRRNPRAMNADVVASVARSVADEVAAAIDDGSRVLVLGGDCTVELGSVAGASREGVEVGLVYVDLDTDLNTPDSVDDGALDWMGVAHLLDRPGCVPALAGIGDRRPLLRPDQLLLFANDNSTEGERRTIADLGIREEPLAGVAANPAGVARRVTDGWSTRFERLLVHVDVDVLDYLDLAIAENTRRNRGLTFNELALALRGLVAAPSWTVLTICELNPDHADSDGASLRLFADAIADVLAAVASDGHGNRASPEPARRMGERVTSGDQSGN